MTKRLRRFWPAARRALARWCAVLMTVALLLVLLPAAAAQGAPDAYPLGNCERGAFSTEEDFVMTKGEPYDGDPYISDGDVLSLDGRVCAITRASDGATRAGRAYARWRRSSAMPGVPEGSRVSNVLAQREAKIRADGEEMAALGDPEAPRNEAENKGRNTGIASVAMTNASQLRAMRAAASSRPRALRGPRAPERAPKIVEHLPAADPGDRAPLRTPARIPSATEDPRQELPVPARPAMLASRRDVVAGEMVFDELDVGDRRQLRQRSLREGRGIGGCSPGRVPRVPPRTRRHHRSPCRYRSPVQRDPGRRRRS